MKCPKCGYTSYDYLDECRKCHHPLGEVRTLLNLTMLRPPQPETAAGLPFPASEGTDEAVNETTDTYIGTPDGSTGSRSPATAGNDLSTMELEGTADTESIPTMPSGAAGVTTVPPPPLESLGTMDMLEDEEPEWKPSAESFERSSTPPSTDRPEMDLGPELEELELDSAGSFEYLDMEIDPADSLELKPEAEDNLELELESEVDLALELEGLDSRTGEFTSEAYTAAEGKDIRLATDEQLLDLELDLEDDEELVKLLAETDPENNRKETR